MAEMSRWLRGQEGPGQGDGSPDFLSSVPCYTLGHLGSVTPSPWGFVCSCERETTVFSLSLSPYGVNRA